LLFVGSVWYHNICFLLIILLNKEVFEMARVCEVCGKGKVSGNNVSHSNRHTKRTWSPNLRNVKAVVEGTPKTIKVCTRCLRSGKVQRAV
jgi:large subunit ribosomal protein L28